MRGAFQAARGSAAAEDILQAGVRSGVSQHLGDCFYTSDSIKSPTTKFEAI